MLYSFQSYRNSSVNRARYQSSERTLLTDAFSINTPTPQSNYLSSSSAIGTLHPTTTYPTISQQQMLAEAQPESTATTALGRPTTPSFIIPTGKAASFTRYVGMSHQSALLDRAIPPAQPATLWPTTIAHIVMNRARPCKTRARNFYQAQALHDGFQATEGVDELDVLQVREHGVVLEPFLPSSHCIRIIEGGFRY